MVRPAFQKCANSNWKLQSVCLLACLFVFFFEGKVVFIAVLAGQSLILMEYGQPLFVWLSRD